MGGPSGVKAPRLNREMNDGPTGLGQQEARLEQAIDRRRLVQRLKRTQVRFHSAGSGTIAAVPGQDQCLGGIALVDAH